MSCLAAERRGGRMERWRSCGDAPTDAQRSADGTVVQITKLTQWLDLLGPSA